MLKNKLINWRVPLFSWCDVPLKEEHWNGLSDQVDHLARLPFIHHHLALMPDGHVGVGMPIGGVLATKNVVVPNAVGKDIGCGVRAIKTNAPASYLTEKCIKDIMGLIREIIPVGFSHQKEEQDQNLMPYKLYALDANNSDMPTCCREYRSALKQLGTLGGGNHFIELQKDVNGYLWIMIHSGSRNLGSKIADHYNKLAKENNALWFSSIPKDWDLAFLPIGTHEARMYLLEMKYALDFARANRELMAVRIINVLNQAGLGVYKELEYDVHHNYVTIENHFGENVWVHRKGATLARKDCIGIIPGSQGTKSYTVKGLGNPDSFQSCSHGAGRVLSRTQARNTLNLQDVIAKLDAKGVVHGIRTMADLDEAPEAYKDIEEVMTAQKDLVKIGVELTPICVIKG